MKISKKIKPKAMAVNIDACIELVKDENGPVPSDMIELVDAVISYYGSLDIEDGCTTPGLDELEEARRAYRGPGIRHFT